MTKPAVILGALSLLLVLTGLGKLSYYLSRLAPGGLVVVRAPLRQFARIAASARAALGLDRAAAAR